MDDRELTRLAELAGILRPDWQPRSVRKFLADHLRYRPFEDTLLALCAVAVRPGQQTPRLLLESGPWWRAADVALERGTPDPPHPMCVHHPQHRAARCPECAVAKAPVPDWAVEMAQRSRARRSAAAVRMGQP